MDPSPFDDMRSYFANLTDPRSANARHHLLDILVIAICAVICGAEGWEDIEEYGHVQASWFMSLLALPHGIPSHDTFRRVLSRLKPDELTHSFLAWTHALRAATAGEIVAIDGKTLRRSFDRAASKAALHLVSAWAEANRLVLGQLKVEAKSNEITAIPTLLRLLHLKDCIVTIDAMGCQKDIAQTIVSQEADYVLALKANHGTLYDNVTLFLQDARSHGFQGLTHQRYDTVDADHGRLETRTYWITSELDWLGAQPAWANLHSIGMVEARREFDTTVETETRFYLTSLRPDAAMFARAVRSHWHVENRLHWVLDVSFREDDCRIRNDQGPENFAVLRHIALNLLQREPRHQRGIKARRKRAGWDRQYLLQVLTG
jgi:predicted transposase YbfD/YdcC